jgi:GNAT superfamily N-acetyltransferase
MSAPVSLRRPRLDEVDALAELHAWSWRLTYGPLMSEEERRMLTVGERRRFWQRVLLEPRPRESQWVAELDGRLVGMVHASPSHDDDAMAGTGEIAAIHVEPGLHGQGIGGRVLAAAEDDLRAAGFHRATLWTLAENHEARRFYEAKGWRADGTTKHVFMGDFDGLPIVDEVRYERDL